MHYFKHSDKLVLRNAVPIYIPSHGVRECPSQQTFANTEYYDFIFIFSRFKFKVYNVVILYRYILQNYYHNKVSYHIHHLA